MYLIHNGVHVLLVKPGGISWKCSKIHKHTRTCDKRKGLQTAGRASAYRTASGQKSCKGICESLDEGVLVRSYSVWLMNVRNRGETEPR